MVAALAPVQVVQASTYLKGATDVTLRKRLLLGWLDKAGRINRSATGKDLNWLIKFKNATASPYTPYQNLNFANDNYWVAASVTPEWWHTTSGMDVTEKTTNSGPSAIVNAYEDRYDELAAAMDKARATVGDFLAAMQRPAQGQSGFIVRKAFPTKIAGKQQILLVNFVTYDGSLLHGKVDDNTSQPGSGIPPDGMVSFPPTEIADWMYNENGKTVGGYMLRVFKTKFLAKLKLTYFSNLQILF